MWWPLFFVTGLVVGSFLNVVIHRLPREQSIVWPGSRCPRCGYPIAWYDNLPLVSYVLLRARCRHCRNPIAWRYPFVELLAGLAAVLVVVRFGFSAPTVVYCAFLWALIAVSFIDIDFQIIPDEISVGGLVVGLLLSGLIPALHDTASRLYALGWSVVGLLVGGGILYLTGLLGDCIFRKESMGGGDIKLLAMAGTVLGWQAVLITFFIAPIFALGPGLALLLFRRTHVIPYGPFLSIALVASLFFGEDLVRISGIGETVQYFIEYYRYSR